MKLWEILTVIGASLAGAILIDRYIEKEKWETRNKAWDEGWEVGYQYGYDGATNILKALDSIDRMNNEDDDWDDEEEDPSEG